VPNLIGDTIDGAASALSSVGLSLGQVGSATDNTCNNINTVMSQNPGAGARWHPGQRSTSPSASCRRHRSSALNPFSRPVTVRGGRPYGFKVLPIRMPLAQ
jgi:hypothetical protein